jgi:methyltransferase (TIGR00027 family)
MSQQPGTASPQGLRRASRMAEVVALFRRGTMAFPPELRPFEDPYAQYFITSPQLRMLPRNAALTRATARITNGYYRGAIGQVVLRTRYADDALRDAMRAGVDQVVMLGSGYDATSARWPPSSLRFFEVDHPETQAKKRAILTEHAPPEAIERTEFVPCDFNTDSPAQLLVAHGFDRTRPAFVNWLGVTFYIPREAVEATLHEVASVAPAGSRMVFDHLHRATADGTSDDAGARRARRRSARVGEPWLYGIDPEDVPAWLAPFGFEVVEQMTGPDLDRRYFPDGQPIYACSYIGHVLAERV